MLAQLDFVQDVLSGLNVRHYNYQDTIEESKQLERMWAAQDKEYEQVLVPFALTVYEDGLDYDEDGNAYFDDYPGEHYASGHLTLKGAEVEAAWLEHHGIAADRIRIVENYWVHRYELKYHPIRG